MSTSGADRTGQADRAGEAGGAGQADRAACPPGPVPAARTTSGTGLAAGEAVEPGAGAVLPGQRPYDLTRLRLPELRALRRDSQRDEADLSYLRRLLQGRIDILRDELSRRAGRRPGPDSGQEPAPGRDGRDAATGRDGGDAESGPEATSGPEPARERSVAAGAGEGRAGEAGAGEAAGTGGGPAQRRGPATVSMVVRLAEILSDAPSRHRTSARHVTLSTPRGAECRRLAAETLAEVELSDLAARTDDELHAAMRRFVRNEQQISRRRHLLQRTVDGCSAEIGRRYREGEAQVDDLLT
jgi:hypothetical protein